MSNIVYYQFQAPPKIDLPIEHAITIGKYVFVGSIKISDLIKRSDGGTTFPVDIKVYVRTKYGTRLEITDKEYPDFICTVYGNITRVIEDGKFIPIVSTSSMRTKWRQTCTTTLEEFYEISQHYHLDVDTIAVAIAHRTLEELCQYFNDHHTPSNGETNE